MTATDVARSEAIARLRLHRELEVDVRAARALNIPEAEIAREAGISRNRVRRILARQTERPTTAQEK